MALQLLLQAYRVAKAFVGLRGELRADSSNWDLLLDDGASPGGHRFLNQSNADSRYQKKSDELDGLNSFEPQNRGFLARRGPSDYRTRSLTVDSDNLTVTNPEGTTGNPKFSLADRIESDHTFGGAQTFEKPIKATGGIKGDVTGNVTGNLTGDSTGKHKGSVDARDSDFLLDDNEIKLAYLEEVIRNRLCPVGSVLLWTGAANAIPSGWKLCDGSGGTPDLRDRFVVGAGGTLAVGAKGGEDEITVDVKIQEGGAHSHGGNTGATALTVDQIPEHYHQTIVDGESNELFPFGADAAPINTGFNVYSQPKAALFVGRSSKVGKGESHAHPLNIENSGAHTHQVAVEPFEAIPPFYALCYIMKG